MTYNKLSVKELKKILEEYNCAIPAGAKKKDLVDLVEAVMAKDEDFVTMQITNEEDIFDAPEEESQEGSATIQEDVGQSENRPSMFSDEWNEFVMAHFHRNELIDGNPICAGLRRVAEYLLGDIIESGPEQVFPATDGSGPDRATVVFKVVFDWMNSGQQRVFKEVADVWHGNTDDLFCAHPVATASTRAEGRALRKALKLRCLAAEELAKKDIVSIVQESVKKTPTSGEYEADTSISSQQIQFIDNKCSTLDIDAFAFINMGNSSFSSVSEVTKDSAKKMIKVLNNYQNNSGDIPSSIRGYKVNWRE
tara:strand:+ start:2608 stop:3531 length:924 start_codon:yes stop_codon:yes gene_type:complete